MSCAWQSPTHASPLGCPQAVMGLPHQLDFRAFYNFLRSKGLRRDLSCSLLVSGRMRPVSGSENNESHSCGNKGGGIHERCVLLHSASSASHAVLTPSSFRNCSATALDVCASCGLSRILRSFRVTLCGVYFAFCTIFATPSLFMRRALSGWSWE